jgi:hypothetical protein
VLLDGDGVRILVLPQSRLEVLAYDDDRLHLMLEGYAIQITETLPEDYRLETSEFTVTDPAEHMAIASTGFISVAEGEATVEIEGETLTVSNGARVTTGETVDEVLNFAEIEGVLDGCPATVTTTGGVELRVRTGAGLEYTPRGAIEDGTEIRLMATALGVGGEWYRIQHRSDFGWVEALAVTADCDTLPMLSTDTGEDFFRLYQVNDVELDFLLPYYDETDPWFFESFR